MRRGTKNGTKLNLAQFALSMYIVTHITQIIFLAENYADIKLEVTYDYKICLLCVGNNKNVIQV